MKKTESILFVVVLLFLFVKLFLTHLPGVNSATILIMLFLSVIYFYFGFAIFNNVRVRSIFKKGSYKDISTKRMIFGVVTGIMLSLTLSGILFKIMFWPGASFILKFSIMSNFVITVIALFKLLKTKSSYYIKILSRNLAFGVIAVVLYIMPAITWVEINYKEYPAIIEAYRKALDEPDNPELWKEVQKVKQKEFEKKAN